MCCSTGICGPSVDPQLIRFAADLEWLQDQGVSVERFNLAQQPAVFVSDREVRSTLETLGAEGLPLVKVNGEVKGRGAYPSRDELAGWAGVAAPAAAPGQEPAPEPKSSGCCGSSSAKRESPQKKSCC
jgi:hypothetical protein